jgi:hypothetical protein
MRKNIVVAILATFTFLTVNHAQQTASSVKEAQPANDNAGQSAGRLPVKRVVLYKNGVGYFEHSTRVSGTQDLNIDFTSAQLNDALKSLTVVARGGRAAIVCSEYFPADVCAPAGSGAAGVGDADSANTRERDERAGASSPAPNGFRSRWRRS